MISVNASTPAKKSSSDACPRNFFWGFYANPLHRNHIDSFLPTMAFCP